MVKNLTSQMVEYGQVKRGELGIMGTELNSELAKAMKVDAQRGAFVSQVLPNSSAAKAGIKAGDVITSLNGKPISSFAALRAQVGTMPVGSKLTLGLLRDGKQVNVNLELQQSSQNQPRLFQHHFSRHADQFAIFTQILWFTCQANYADNFTFQP